MSEIYRLTIKCIDGAYLKDDYSWVVEVPGEMTLEQLHFHILVQTEFEHDHLADFFIARDIYTRKRTWLTYENESEWERSLSSIYPLEANQRLYYLFDFGDNWIFSISKRGKPKPAKPGHKYPEVIKITGKIPEQYPDTDDWD